MIKKENNIEWLRLLLAFQVMFVHVFHHLEKTDLEYVSLFPGVPAFFFLSGFLIYASFDKNQSLANYFLNRFLRIYPALFLVTVAGFFVVFFSSYLDGVDKHLQTYVTWFLAQITIGQAFNPDEFRDIGVGVINGSLWTISVEIIFYISVPFIYFFDKKFKFTIPLILIISLIISKFGRSIFDCIVTNDKVLYDFMLLTPITWMWMFMFGIIFYKNFDFLYKNVRLLKFSILPMLGIVYFDWSGFFFNTSGNGIGLVYFILYAFIVFYLAFGVKYIQLKFDISYGVYIWHMVVVNLLIILGFKSVGAAIVLTIVLSLISWYFIEKPFLTLKKRSLKCTRLPIDEGAK